jgi:hypothetical protein
MKLFAEKQHITYIRENKNYLQMSQYKNMTRKALNNDDRKAYIVNIYAT